MSGDGNCTGGEKGGIFFILIIRINLGRSNNRTAHIKSGRRNSFLPLGEKHFTHIRISSADSDLS